MKSLRRKFNIRKVRYKQKFPVDVKLLQLSTGVVNTLALFFTAADQRTAYRPLRLRLSWGLSDDPLDELLHLALIWRGGVINDITDVLDNAVLYNSSQRWRSIGTVGQIIQTHENIDEDLSDISIEVSLGDPLEDPVSLALLVESDTTSIVDAFGSVDVEITLTQITEPDDPQDWAGYEFEESIQGMIN